MSDDLKLVSLLDQWTAEVSGLLAEYLVKQTDDHILGMIKLIHLDPVAPVTSCPPEKLALFGHCLYSVLVGELRRRHEVI